MRGLDSDVARNKQVGVVFLHPTECSTNPGQVGVTIRGCSVVSWPVRTPLINR